MEREPTPDRADGSDTDPGVVNGDLSRKHWIVPVHGLTGADPDGIVQAIARRDGAVSLHMACGDSRTTGWLDVSRAAQLSTGIWEAAGAGRQPTGYLGDDQPLTTTRAHMPPPRRTTPTQACPGTAQCRDRP